MDRKKDGEQEPGRLSASKENIRSPFIFINKTSRRVRSAGDAENRESTAAGRRRRGRRGRQETKGWGSRRNETDAVESNGRATDSRRGGLRLFLNNNEMQSS